MKTTQQIVAECEHQRRVDIHAHNTQPALTGCYLLAAQSVAKPRPTRWRGLWRILRAFLPLLILITAASANTVIVDLAGNIVGRFDWPRDHFVVVVVPTWGGLHPLPGTPAPGTPAPKP
jgi:hypothetical protein